MPIQIQLTVTENGRSYAPMIVCDFCHKNVLAADGNYAWMVDANSNQTSPLYFVHKQCSGAHEEQLGHPTMMRGELQVFLTYLGRNAEHDAKVGEEMANLSASD